MRGRRKLSEYLHELEQRRAARRVWRWIMGYATAGIVLGMTVGGAM